jgi:hypothetical protein
VKRILVSIAAGALGMFLLDPDAGDRRRRRALGAFDPNRGSIKEARKASRRATRQAAKTVGLVRRDLSGNPSGPSAGSWVLALTGVAAAAAAGAALTYLFDTDRGAQRRVDLGNTLRQKQDQLARQGANAANAANGAAAAAREKVAQP